MAKISLTLTEEHLKLVRNFNYKRFDDNRTGVDKDHLWGGTFIFEQMAHILGEESSMIADTEEDTDGPKYPIENIERYKELDEFITSNIIDIENLVHQYCDRGGVKPNVKYVAYDYENIWYTEEEWKKIGRR